MKIVLDERNKEAALLKNDGTEISRYSYKKIIDDEFTIEDFKKDIDSFNVTLSRQEEFDNIKEMLFALKIHSW